MKWFISHPSGGMQHTPTFFDAIKQFTEERSGIEVTYPHEQQAEVQLTQTAITEADLVLVEVSVPSTGSGIELGWANAAGKKIIAFHQGGSEPSPSVKFVTSEVHTYVTQEHIIDVLETLIT